MTSFAAQLRRVRLRNAAEPLAHQPLTVTDVARLVDDRQPSHFVKACRAGYRTTSGAYRDRMRARRDARDAAHDDGEAAKRHLRQWRDRELRRQDRRDAKDYARAQQQLLSSNRQHMSSTAMQSGKRKGSCVR